MDLTSILTGMVVGVTTAASFNYLYPMVRTRVESSLQKFMTIFSVNDRLSNLEQEIKKLKHPHYEGLYTGKYANPSKQPDLLMKSIGPIYSFHSPDELNTTPTE